MREDHILHATVRENIDEDWLDIECRFANGEKFVAVQVVADHPVLASRIAALLPNNSAKNSGELTKDEHDLWIMRSMEATNAFICWECQTVKIKNSDWFAKDGCEVCGDHGHVLPFLLRPKEDSDESWDTDPPRS